MVVLLTAEQNAMLLNGFDVDPGPSERTVELQLGDLFELGIQADVLVVSAVSGVPEPIQGTLLHRLDQACGLHLDQIPRQLDLTACPIGAWVSQPLEGLRSPCRWPPQSSTRFTRLVVVEYPSLLTQSDGQDPWPVFRQLFSLLAVLPMHGVDCRVVATPLLGPDSPDSVARRVFPDLLRACRNGFRHVPDLERLIVFDSKRDHLERLAQQIDRELGRQPGGRDLVDLMEVDRLRVGVLGRLTELGRLHPDLCAEVDLTELSFLLRADQVTPVALGMHSRRLVERLVRHHLGWRQGGLYHGLQVLRRRELSPWILSCLHQVRVYGNWMGHPSSPERYQVVTSVDLAALLAALHRVLEAYPWS